MTLDEQAVGEIRAVYLVSNTPLYMFKRMRRLPVVQQLATALSGPELVAQYLLRARKKDRTPDDIAVAYACLVALTCRPSGEATSLLESVDLSGLQWGPYIRYLNKTKLPVSQSARLELPPQPVPTVEFASRSTSASGTMPSPKPRIDVKVGV